MAVTYLGIQSRRTRVIVRGTFAGTDERFEAARSAVLTLVDRARTHPELVAGLGEIARREGMVLETGDPGLDVFAFYLWQPDQAEPPTAPIPTARPVSLVTTHHGRRCAC